MPQRHVDRGGDPHPARSQPPAGRRTGSPVLALQRAVGNRATGQVLARKGGRGTAENSVRVGKLGSVDVVTSNVADWIGKTASAEDLVVTTRKGRHSDQLRSLSDTRSRVDSIELTTVTGENSWVVVTFKNSVVTGYTADAAGETESWKAVRFDAVDIKRTSIGKPRP